MQHKPKLKICRRLGTRVFSKCENPRFTTTPKFRMGAGGKRPRGRSISEFGTQLLEKQRVRYTYNLRERQFAKYVREASAKKSVNPTEHLYRTLESRLDNILFRLGFTKSRAAARQMVSHGHIMVNGRRITIASMSLRPGDVLQIRPGSKNKELFAGLSERLKEHAAPKWLLLDENKLEGTVKALPAPDNTTGESFNLTSLIEFYGR